MKQKIPNHLGIILDGNRRWAKENNLPSFEGHLEGYKNVKKIGLYALNKGVKILTVFAFSTENWNRDEKEVNYLMKLLGQFFIKKSLNEYHKNGIKINLIGQKERLPELLQKKAKEAEELTKNNKSGILNLAISYGGRPDIIQSIKKIIKKGISANDITEDLINQNLWTAGLPYPDLIIRTGGEQRLSGFLTWQSVYSELYFTQKYWPAFSKEDLDMAFEDYGQRERRFGK